MRIYNDDGLLIEEVTIKEMIGRCLSASPIISVVLVSIAAALVGYSAHGTSGVAYASAQECAINAKTELGARSCYSLYPTAPTRD